MSHDYGSGTYLTLTRVVFEFTMWKCIIPFLVNLTLTRVVFECDY